MDINTINSTSVNTPPGKAAPDVPRAVVSSDFETFLKMLTVQMQNQDPLNPVDSSDYATQLATFSGVEQQVQTNDLLKALSATMGTGGLTQLAGWVGMEARAAVPAYFDGAPITVVPDVRNGADEAQLVVRDSSGAEVQRLRIDIDDGPLDWAGVTTDGAPLPPGFYSFETVSIALGEVVAEVPSEVYTQVTEVQLDKGVNTLVLRGGQTVAATAVTAVRDGAA